MRPRALDLFCAAGGVSAGLHRAGFDVTGVDIAPQPHYPFPFVQADALHYVAEHAHRFHVIAASPPCFVHSDLAAVLPAGHGHVDLIPATRTALQATGLPYVIENVEGAPLHDPLVLCGSMFGLGAQCGDGWRELRRHRLFESDVALTAPGPCRHVHPVISAHGGGPTRRAPGCGRGGYQGLVAERRAAMGIEWMTRAEMNLAIPPAYAEHVGAQLLAHLSERAA
jgi:DNA (cytosine-5)-methyltransferase 1